MSVNTTLKSEVLSKAGMIDRIVEWAPTREDSETFIRTIELWSAKNNHLKEELDLLSRLMMEITMICRPSSEQEGELLNKANYLLKEIMDA